MKIFKPEECATPPRADMFLPNWLKIFGFCLDGIALVCLVITFVTQIWGFIVGFAISGALGISAWLCWKNQSIKIIDDDKFAYTTFLGNRKVYYFSEIKQLRSNDDSWTLFVGGGKVHIEFAAYISEALFYKINEAIDKKRQF